jgi:hypothetical protein
MAEHLTAKDMRAIAKEVTDFNALGEQSRTWKILSIEHLYLLKQEVFVVRYIGNFASAWMRDKFTNKLTPASVYTYYAPNFDDHEQASTPESEGGNGN